MTEGPIKVFLVDDHAMFRGGLSALIAAETDMILAGSSAGGPDLLEEVVSAAPTVVVMDIGMPGLNGLDACRALLARQKGLAILILTMHDDEEFITRALEYGASGYLLKDAAPDEFIKSVRAVARGEFCLGPGISNSVIQKIGRPHSDGYEALTLRERQVLQLAAEGKTNREIAQILDTSIKTVDMHRMHMMKKLDIHDQTALVKYALRKGLVHL